MGGAIPGQVVLGAVRKQDEQGMESKSVSRVLPRPLLQFQSQVACLELRPWLPLMMDYKL